MRLWKELFYFEPVFGLHISSSNNTGLPEIPAWKGGLAQSQSQRPKEDWPGNSGRLEELENNHLYCHLKMTKTGLWKGLRSGHVSDCMEGNGRCLEREQGLIFPEHPLGCLSHFPGRFKEQRALCRWTKKAKRSSCGYQLQEGKALRIKPKTQNICLRVWARSLRDQEKNLSPQNSSAHT